MSTPLPIQDARTLGDVQALARLLVDAGVALGGPKVPAGLGAVPYAIVPAGASLQQLDAEQTARVPGNPSELLDPPSFCRYFLDHATPASRIYATDSGLNPGFVAVFDDYADGDGHSSGFAFRAWRAVYVPVFSPEWLAWDKNAGPTNAMDQAEFAEFLEDQAPDIVEPDGSTLRELILNMEISTGGSFSSTLRQQDGSHALVYRNEHQQLGQVRLPERLRLSIPVYRHTPAVPLEVLLRFRLRQDKLSFFYVPVRPQRVVESAFQSLAQAIAAGCAQEGRPHPVLLGRVTA